MSIGNVNFYIILHWYNRDTRILGVCMSSLVYKNAQHETTWSFLFEDYQKTILVIYIERIERLWFRLIHPHKRSPFPLSKKINVWGEGKISSCGVFD